VDWVCWALLVLCLIYFVRIDRVLQKLRHDHESLIEQLVKWGIVRPDGK
jgi:hypothetical protein